MTIYRLTHPTTGAQATRTSDRVFTHGIICSTGRASFAGSLQLAHASSGQFRPDLDARVVPVELLERLPKKPKVVDPEAEQRRITVCHLTGDKIKSRRVFTTLVGAQRFARNAVTTMPTVGNNFAVSPDGAHAVTVTGCSLAQLFPYLDPAEADGFAQVSRDADARFAALSPEQQAAKLAEVAELDAQMREGARHLADAMIDNEAAALEELLAPAADSASTAVALATPTSETYAALQQAYDHFNARLFQGRLPPCLITLQRKEHRVHGYFWANRFQTAEGVKVDEIAMNPQHFGRDIEQTLSTLVHEMTHLEHEHFGTPSRKGYHNAAWGQLMIRVGLQPSDTGLPGGKTTGQKMTHYIMRGGRFEEACHELLMDGAFRLRWREVAEAAGPAKKKKATRAKYVCPDCSLQMWGKPASKLICGACEVPMPEEGAEEGEDDC